MKIKLFKHLLVIIILSSSSGVKANFKSMLKELIDINYDWKNIEAKKEFAYFDLQAEVYKRPWTLALDSSYTDSELESNLGVVSPTKTISTGVKVSKGTLWGGTFALGTDFSKVKNTSTLFGRSSDVAGFSQSVSYTQDLSKDFFGQSSYLTRDKFYVAYQKSEIDLNKEREFIIMELFNKYAKALWMKKVYTLQLDAHKRSIRRTKLIKRKVRDGLREKVDLLQARSSQIKQEELIVRTKRDLQIELDELSKLLNRTVSQKELQVFKVPDFKNKNLENNKEILSTRHNIEILNKDMKIGKYNKRPDVQLNVAYNTNDYDSEFDESISSGNLFDGNKELVASINISLPFDNEVLSNRYMQGQINYNVELVKLNKLLMDSLITEKSLNSNFDDIRRNISLAKSREGIVSKTVKEYNKLYNLGRADLDQIISSEEELIQTQKTLAGYQYEAQIIKAKLLALYGEVTPEMLLN